MKKVFTSILLFSFTFCKAQPDTAISYTGIEVNNVQQMNLYSRARSWVDNNFKNMRAVLSINDKETGELAGKGIMKFEIGYMGKDRNMVPVTIEFKMDIRVKDGKYKYDFSDFDVLEFWDQRSDIGILTSNSTHQWFGTKKWSAIAYQETKDKVNDQMQDLIISLKDAMNKNNDF